MGLPIFNYKETKFSIYSKSHLFFPAGFIAVSLVQLRKWFLSWRWHRKSKSQSRLSASTSISLSVHTHSEHAENRIEIANGVYKLKPGAENHLFVLHWNQVPRVIPMAHLLGTKRWDFRVVTMHALFVLFPPTNSNIVFPTHIEDELFWIFLLLSGSSNCFSICQRISSSPPAHVLSCITFSVSSFFLLQLLLIALRFRSITCLRQVFPKCYIVGRYGR